MKSFDEQPRMITEFKLTNFISLANLSFGGEIPTTSHFT